MIIKLSTINEVTGNGGYKLGVKALITKIKFRDTMIIREKNTKTKRERDCRELIVCF